MEAVLTGIYCLGVCAKKAYRGTHIAVWGKELMRCLMAVVTGMMIAAPVLMPVIIQMLQDSRLTEVYHIPLTYGYEYYKELPAMLITSSC